MKTIRTRNGPFAERPHYKLSEIDRTCADALKSTGLLPDSPEPVRIERFIEKYFNVSPRYEPLPDGVLGFTEFGKDGVKAIVVSTALDDEGSKVAERRIRTTLAHEGGHGLFHMHLFALGEKPQSLFDDDDARPEILCRDIQGEGAAHGGYDGRWWEYQANRAIGGLLLPRPLIRKAVEPFCKAKGGLGLPAIKADERERAVRELAGIFDVNPIVARIRLDGMFPVATPDQLML